MDSLPEFVGTVHIFLGPYRGNPIALYLLREAEMCRIAPRIYPWNRTVGQGENPNKAAADFEQKWKESSLSSDLYTGPHWEGGIKPEKPKPAVPPKPPVSQAKTPPAKVDPSPSPSPPETETSPDSNPPNSAPSS